MSRCIQCICVMLCFRWGSRSVSPTWSTLPLPSSDPSTCPRLTMSTNCVCLLPNCYLIFIALIRPSPFHTFVCLFLYFILGGIGLFHFFNCFRLVWLSFSLTISFQSEVKILYIMFDEFHMLNIYSFTINQVTYFTSIQLCIKTLH